VYLRFAASILALAAGAAGIVVAVMLLRSVPGPTSTTSAAPTAPSHTHTTPPKKIAGGRIPTPTEPGFPSPPPGAVVLAQQAGSRALALAVKRGLVRVSVLKPLGGGESGLNVSLQFGQGYYLPADPCGPGCYQVQVNGAWPVSPVTVRIGKRPYRFDLPSPATRRADADVARATATWNALRSLVWHERLASSPTNVIHVGYRAVAPDRLAYTIADGSSSVIIGNKRWDRPTPRAPWEASAQDPPVRQPQPFWQQATDARVLGSTPTTIRVSFFDPVTPAWFEATIDRRTSRTLRLQMITAAHFMHDVYGPFNSPLQLVPPA
jgi:hypothetical protein